MNRTIFELVILLAVSIAAAFAGNAINPSGIPLFGQWSSESGIVHAGGPCAPDTKQILDIDVMDYYLSSKALFVDARSADDYAAGHIPRSVNLPVSEIDNLIYIFLETHSPDTKIITYCSGVDCHDSHELAGSLEEYGYSDVTVYSQGMDEWKEQGRPIEILESGVN